MNDRLDTLCPFKRQGWKDSREQSPDQVTSTCPAKDGMAPEGTKIKAGISLSAKHKLKRFINIYVKSIPNFIWRHFATTSHNLTPSRVESSVFTLQWLNTIPWIQAVWRKSWDFPRYFNIKQYLWPFSFLKEISKNLLPSFDLVVFHVFSSLWMADSKLSMRVVCFVLTSNRFFPHPYMWYVSRFLNTRYLNTKMGIFPSEIDYWLNKYP